MGADTGQPVAGTTRQRALAAALLLAGAGLSLWGAWVKSETFDEPMYILSGYSYWVTGDFSLNREHPPLAKLLAGLPLLALDLSLPDQAQRRPGIAFAFLFHQPRADPHTMLFLARLPGVALGVLLGLYVLRWARALFGPRAGLAALALVALNPNLLGHARVAANDFAVTVFVCATLYHAWRWLEGGRDASLLWAAVALGLALASKLTALLLLPVLGLLVLGVVLSRRRPALLGRACLALLAAGSLLWAVYGGEARSLADARQHARFLLPGEEERVLATPGLEAGLQALFGEQQPIPLLSYVKGVDRQRAHAGAGHPNHFLGRSERTGHPGYYALTWLVKNPEGLTLLLLLGLLALHRTGRGWVAEACLYGFSACVLLLFSASDAQLGFKYVLPALPPLCVAASRVFADGPRAGVQERWAGAALVLVVSLGAWLLLDQGDAGWRAWTPVLLALTYGAWRTRGRWPSAASVAPAGLLLAWASAGSLLRQPHDLMYFNEWAGGPEQGWRISVIGDDWGQDTALLGRWMAQHGVAEVFYDPYGTGDPEAWGVSYRPTRFAGRAREGWLAVHVASLARRPEDYAWLAGREPDQVLGHSIRLYRLTARDRTDALFEALRRDRRER